MYRCPKCQTPKIMPIASNDPNAPRPNVPKSLMLLLPSIFVLLFLGIFSIINTLLGNSMGTTLKGLILAAFILTAVSAIFFMRDLPNFKLSLQAYIKAQKRWKCRECHHQWEN